MTKKKLTTIFVVLTLAVVIASCSDDDPMTPENSSPVLVDLRDTTISVGNTLRTTALATDPDGDPINYHLTVMIRGIHDPLPAASIDARTGEIIFRPTPDDRPSRDFVVRAQDGRGGEDATSFTATVN